MFRLQCVFCNTQKVSADAVPLSRSRLLKQGVTGSGLHFRKIISMLPTGGTGGEQMGQEGKFYDRLVKT